MNPEVLVNLLSYSISENILNYEKDYVYTKRYFIDNYKYNYSHDIVQYYKACGCNIERANWNFFGGFYVYYTAPTKYIDPKEFIKTYKFKRHYTLESKFFIFVFIMIFIMSIFLLTSKSV